MKFIKRGHNRAKKVHPSVSEDAPVFFVQTDEGEDLGHIWRPTRRVEGLMGYILSEDWKAASVSGDGFVLVHFPSPSSTRTRSVFKSRPAAVKALLEFREKCLTLVTNT